MKIPFIALAVLCIALPCPVILAQALIDQTQLINQEQDDITSNSRQSAAQSENLSDWTKLIDGKKCKAAKALCGKFVESKKIAQQVEAQKCLANAALCGHGILYLEGNESGGGTIRGSYKPKALDEALAHLNLGIKLAPQDLSIHLGRLHVLEVSGRYDEMIKALDESCSIYKGKDAQDAWLPYAPELANLGQYSVGVDFMKVLDKHYPDSPDIIANIGAFLLYLKRFDEAIPYLQKAAALAPEDSLNAWDLGRAYDYSNQIALADKWYQKALSLPPDRDMASDAQCLYAVFVETKLKDRTRACTLEKQSCAAKQQTACVPSAVAAKKAE